MPPKKKISPAATPFLKTAAEAIGSALGKLAVKTGVATPRRGVQEAIQSPGCCEEESCAKEGC